MLQGSQTHLQIWTPWRHCWVFAWTSQILSKDFACNAGSQAFARSVSMLQLSLPPNRSDWIVFHGNSMEFYAMVCRHACRPFWLRVEFRCANERCHLESPKITPFGQSVSACALNRIVSSLGSIPTKYNIVHQRTWSWSVISLEIRYSRTIEQLISFSDSCKLQINNSFFDFLSSQSIAMNSQSKGY